MEFSLRTADALSAKTSCLVIAVAEDRLTGVALAADKATGGTLSALNKSGDFAGKSGQSLLLPVVPSIDAQRILLVGAGKEVLNDQGYLKLASNIANQLVKLKVKDALLCLDAVAVTGRDLTWLAQQVSRLSVEATYQFTRFKSTKPSKVALQKITLHSSSKGKAAIKKALASGAAIAHGVNEARELGDLPGNICNPSFLASRARAFAKGNSKLSCNVLEEKQMKELGMGSLLSVTAGTETPAKLIVTEYKGGKKGDRPIVLVGKGVTFDTGGISLKSGAGMDEMKYDMGGAASVFGTLKAIAEIELPINVVGIVGAVENMPGGKATKPGDIVTSMSGQTIEVLNTDAEGRLVLCDALSYAGKFNPATVIDIATLTSGVIIGLGHHANALFSNDDALAADLLKAGINSTDRAWQLPIWDEYNQQLTSNFADIPNIAGRDASSITAACFLSRFTTTYKWAHLDIAGTFWRSGANKGATGRPVPMLVEYLMNQTT